MSRYQRQIKLSEIGIAGQEKLKHSNVTIIGTGGLGVPASLYLAGAGVGTINLIDFDTVELSNLHRQVIFTEKDIGRSKSEILAKHLSSLNSEIVINSISKYFSPENAIDLLANTDIVLDCSDNLETRYLINDTCIKLNKPFVSASIYKYEAQLSVFNYNNGPSFRCLYKNRDDASQIASCEDTGVIGTLPGIVGAMQANETIKLLLDLGDVLSGKVLLTNILNYNTSIFKLDKNEKNFEDVKKKGLAPRKRESETGVGIEWEEVVPMISEAKVKLIDIRELHESPRLASELITDIPLDQNFGSHFNTSDSSVIVCFCQSGIRSIVAARKLRDIGIEAYSLNRGIEALTESNIFRIKNETLA